MRAGEPRTIAIAKAAQLAVTMLQLQHQATQRSLLAAATAQRLQSERQLLLALRSLKVHHIAIAPRYTRSLAVYPTPVDSLTPDYKEDLGFTVRQQEGYRFQINLDPGFLTWRVPALTQMQECSASLTRDGRGWSPRILAANVHSRL